MVKAYLKWLKASLASEVRNLGFSKLLPLFVLLNLADFLDASNQPIVLLPPTTSLSSTLKADTTDDLVVFNMAVIGAAILLKPLIKRR